MAWLQAKGKYWQAGFRDNSGKVFQRSTKVLVSGKDKAETRALKAKAGIVATKYEMAVRGEIGNSAYFRRTLSDLMDLSGSSQKLETLESWSKKYLDVALRRNGAGYHSGAKKIIDALIGQVGGDLPLEAVSSESVQQALDARSKIRATATVSKERKLLSKCFSDAVRQGIVERNPVAATFVAKVVSTGRDPFTEKEVGQLLSHADAEWRRVVEVGAMTGLRLRDAISVGAEHYDSGLDALRMTESKTGKPLTIPVNAKLRKALELEYIAPTLRTLSNGALNKRFLKIMEAAGIDRGESHSPGAKNTTYRKSFHSLRHTFISRLTNAGVDPEIRRKLAGHASAEIHEIYTHHNIERMREAIGKLG